jgi:hypothetical protein
VSKLKVYLHLSPLGNGIVAMMVLSEAAHENAQLLAQTK